MNEQDNIGIIRSVYAAFAAGDAATILGHIADNAPWINYGSPSVPYTGERAGKAQIMEFFQAIAGSTTGGEVVADTYLANGDTVVTLGRYRATVRSTGVAIDVPIVHVFTLRDGKITRWEGFSDTEKVARAHALRAASA